MRILLRAVEFREVLKRRRMVRAYERESIPRATLERIVATIRRAPSAGFSQGQRFIVVTESERKRSIADATGEEDYVGEGFSPWISGAAALVGRGDELRREYLHVSGEHDIVRLVLVKELHQSLVVRLPVAIADQVPVQAELLGNGPAARLIGNHYRRDCGRCRGWSHANCNRDRPPFHSSRGSEASVRYASTEHRYRRWQRRYSVQ